MKVVNIGSDLDLIAVTITLAGELHFAWKPLVFEGSKECLDAGGLDVPKSMIKPPWFRWI
jgi:hypothetical protein